jgi:hypothetical protein
MAFEMEIIWTNQGTTGKIPRNSNFKQFAPIFYTKRTCAVGTTGQDAHILSVTDIKRL